MNKFYVIIIEIIAVVLTGIYSILNVAFFWKRFQEEKMNYFTQIYPYVIAFKMKDKKIGIFKDSLDFVNMMGSYADAQYYVNEYTSTIPNS